MNGKLRELDAVLLGMGKISYRSINGIMIVAILILGTISIAAPVSAVTLNPGDIIVTDLNEFGGPGSVFRVHPVTGAQTIICSACISDPGGVDIDANGDIIVTDVTSSLTHPFPHPGSIVRVNPATGAVTTISSGGLLVDPIGIAIDANGDLIVVDEDGFGGPGGIIKVNPATGAQTPISSGGLFFDPAFVTIDSNGDFIVSEQTAFGSAIIRVNQATGAQTLISSGTSGLAYGKAIDANGDIISGSGGSIVRVNPATGAVTIISSGGLLTQVIGVTIDANGDIISANFGPARIIRVHPVTGAQTLVSSGGSFIDPFGVAIYPALGPSFTVSKDFRFTNVNFSAEPAELGALLPRNDSKFNVTYVTKPKDGTVSSTNPGQLYGVITVNGSGVDMVNVTDTFGFQFDVNPAKLGGGVEVIRVNGTTGIATVITNTAQVTSASVDNVGNMVTLNIDLDTPLGADEKLMVYIKFQTALKGLNTVLVDFMNDASIVINNNPATTATATIEFV